MTIQAPRDPFSEVVDERRRWMPDWYSWLLDLVANAGVLDGDKGDITVSALGTVWTIDNDVVTYAKMQNVSAASKLLGRGDSGAGDPQEITLGTNLSMSGTTLNVAGLADGDKGDITVSGGGATWTIDNNVVTYAKMQDVSATARFLGRITAGAGDTEELTGTQATSLLDAFTSSLKGLVPASGGGTVNFLRADATFAAPPDENDWVLIQSQVASSSAQLDFETGLDDTYDAYLFTLSNIAPATDDDQLVIRVKVSGSYQTTGYKRQITTSSGSAVGCSTNTAATAITINLNGASSGVGNAANETLEGTVRFSNPDAGGKVIFVTQAAFIRADSDPATVHSSGWYDTAGAVTGIRFLFGAGNIASGRISLYGLKKS